MATKYYYSPVGELGQYPWISKPDTKYKDDGLFHAKHIVPAGAKGDAFKAFIQEAAQAALDQHKKDVLKANQHKDWSIYLPFEDEEDMDGKPSGRTIYSFAQNATIRLKDTGEVKEIHIAVYDANDELLTKSEKGPDGTTYTNPAIFGRTVGVFKYAIRPIVIASAKKVGVRLDFSAYQIIRAPEASPRSGGFGKAEDSEGYSPASEPSSPYDDDIPF